MVVRVAKRTGTISGMVRMKHVLIGLAICLECSHAAWSQQVAAKSVLVLPGGTAHRLNATADDTTPPNQIRTGKEIV
jgi:hypothetical protein